MGVTKFGDPRLPTGFWEKVRQAPGPLETPCWLWVAAADPHGYGRYGRPTRLAHRVSYESLVGSIKLPHVDHLCRNPPCVNPEHLEPVTARENMIRGESPLADNARKTQCVWGHPFDTANTRVVIRSGRLPSRECRECSRQRSLRRYYANRETINEARKVQYHANKEKRNEVS